MNLGSLGAIGSVSVAAFYRLGLHFGFLMELKDFVCLVQWAFGHWQVFALWYYQPRACLSFRELHSSILMLHWRLQHHLYIQCLAVDSCEWSWLIWFSASDSGDLFRRRLWPVFCGESTHARGLELCLRSGLNSSRWEWPSHQRQGFSQVFLEEYD